MLNIACDSWNMTIISLYRISDDQYYTIPGIQYMRVDGPPRPLRQLGVDRVDGAFMATNGRGMRDTILFRGNQYYKVNDATFRVRIALNYM